MTKDEILNMSAGREMDILIAETFNLFRSWRNARRGDWFHDATEQKLLFAGRYSTDIADAWKVVEEMGRKGYSFSLISDSTHPDGLVIYLAAFRNRYASNGPTIEGFGDTPAFAICRAALLAAIERDKE